MTRQTKVSQRFQSPAGRCAARGLRYAGFHESLRVGLCRILLEQCHTCRPYVYEFVHRVENRTSVF